MTNIKKELDIRTDRMKVNMGPSHPVTHGTLHIILELDGETIVGSEAKIGYLHRGVEKLGENRTYEKFLPFTDRMNYTSSINNNVGYTHAVEKLLGVEPPPRAQVLEVIACELGRIADHIVCVGINAVDVGAFTAFLYIFKFRELIYDIFSRMSGARLYAMPELRPIRIRAGALGLGDPVAISAAHGDADIDTFLSHAAASLRAL